jgi:hypothetical protein
MKKEESEEEGIFEGLNRRFTASGRTTKQAHPRAHHEEHM